MTPDKLAKGLTDARRQFGDLRRLVQRSASEIIGQTYGRKPHEMAETDQWWKLQMAERWTRDTRDEAFATIDHAVAAIDRMLAPSRPSGRGLDKEE